MVARILPPPAIGGSPIPRRDDWSMLAAPTIPAEPATSPAEPKESGDDAANAGIRQEPELPIHENIAPSPPTPSGEFDFAESDGQGDAARLRQAADRQMARNARTASLDPDDGIDL
jgi:type IV secretion system protein VirD4